MDNTVVTYEARLIKTETTVENLHSDLKDIKKYLRWLTGLVFSINTTIIGILAKGFEYL